MSGKPEYFSETQKIKPKIDKYLNGNIIDIGCGKHKITPEATGVDQVDHYGVVNYVTNHLDQLASVRPEWVGNFDVVYSSHCLEHVKDDLVSLKEWVSLLKPGGYLILYLPDDDHYDNDSNPEHLQRYTYLQFMKDKFLQLENVIEVESGPHIGYDCYSFYVVGKKK